MRDARERAMRAWHPLRDLLDYPKGMENWLSMPQLSHSEMRSDFKFAPSCEVNEDAEGYHFHFDLPGVPKENIHIDVSENQLTVSGERREEKRNEGRKKHFSELYYGSFMRSFTLPSGVDAEKVVAEYKEGVLNIDVPKESQKANTRRVSVR